MSDDYKPFPEFELQTLATFHDSVAGHHPPRSFLQHVHEERATACRDAIDCQNALRERCQLAEFNLRNAEAVLAEHGLPFERVTVEATNAA